ncbi:hypothetical protein H257_12276 [Aphanomyces astaci]|uniref:Uncharacterized protein n=1 Tax=Aphanomyces astaci TaxID=112090 RepID=W4FZP7_APHAT|nr:hypothetical protein H257_12276 [Aphanomyces astaci]ETV72945.1 hypothetical protein H257_12276 [Aphanomyces astaci]|eukprot:XP_009837731.1 hypothetical protein H257_12276 [Aphanomyces astaci]
MSTVATTSEEAAAPFNRLTYPSRQARFAHHIPTSRNRRGASVKAAYGSLRSTSQPPPVGMGPFAVDVAPEGSLLWCSNSVGIWCHTGTS